MLVKKKPLMFVKKTPVAGKPDVENAADAKKPGDAKEDAKDKRLIPTKKANKAKGKPSTFYATKAATALTKQ